MDRFVERVQPTCPVCGALRRDHRFYAPPPPSDLLSPEPMIDRTYSFDAVPSKDGARPVVTVQCGKCNHIEHFDRNVALADE